MQILKPVNSPAIADALPHRLRRRRGEKSLHTAPLTAHHKRLVWATRHRRRPPTRETTKAEVFRPMPTKCKLIRHAGQSFVCGKPSELSRELRKVSRARESESCTRHPVRSGSSAPRGSLDCVCCVLDRSEPSGERDGFARRRFVCNRRLRACGDSARSPTRMISLPDSGVQPPCLSLPRVNWAGRRRGRSCMTGGLETTSRERERERELQPLNTYLRHELG